MVVVNLSQDSRSWLSSIAAMLMLPAIESDGLMEEVMFVSKWLVAAAWQSSGSHG